MIGPNVILPLKLADILFDFSYRFAMDFDASKTVFDWFYYFGVSPHLQSFHFDDDELFWLVFLSSVPLILNSKDGPD